MSDDEDDLFTDPEPETPPAAQADPKMKQLRERAKQAADLERANAEMAAQLAEFQAKQRDQDAKAAFSEAKLPEGLAPLFAKTHEGEITKEAVEEFARTSGLKIEEPKQEPQAGGFEPTGGGVPPGPQKLSRAELDQLFKTNPAQAMQVVNEGRWTPNNPEQVAAAMGQPDDF